MPGLTGIEVLGKIRQLSPETQVIILTGHATVDTAVQALRLGAFDYLTKPCKWAELEVILNRVAERRDLANKATALETRLKAAEGPPHADRRDPGDAGGPPPDRHDRADRRQRDDPGRDRHRQGADRPRACTTRAAALGQAFIPVNCGALPENLVESELFGHRKGAFTGADTHRKGLFEVANGGTLFLDEVGELDKSVQVKLLRFLESGEIRRVGENDPFRVDVRVLCATNRDLREMIAADQFREDLFFRINTFEIHLPPLRDRKADIPPLAQHMLNRFASRRSGTISTLTPDGDRDARRARLAGQHPRAGQRHRARHDPRRRRPDQPRAPADPVPGRGVRFRSPPPPRSPAPTSRSPRAAPPSATSR